jgi:ABC-type dipeptide/oligopeptide/nickel transport system permease component
LQKYLLSRFLQAVLILLGILVIVFFMVRIAGDPVNLMVPREASDEYREEFRHMMGYDRPLLVQLGDFMSKAVLGDFGNSLHFKEPAMPMVIHRLPATLELAGVGMIMAIVVAIPLGLIGGFRPGTWIDTFGRFLGLLGQSTPGFWLALLLIFYFAVELRLLPSFGRDNLKSIILPAFVMGFGGMGALVRLTRSATMEIRSEDYVRTARSKGLFPKTIYTKHVLRNVLIPLVSVIGVSFGYSLGGSIYIETIFAWPGMGQLLQQAIGWRDYPLIQALAVFTSVVVIGMSLLTDVAYALIDPRIRYDD